MPAPVSLKDKIAAGGAFGPMVIEFFSPGLPAIVAATGADFILYDMEHSGAGFETMKGQFAGCRGLGVAPLVRVPAGEYHFVARAFDMGAHGVMVPMVETAEEAARIVSYANYPPYGRRGAAFGVAHDDYLPGSPADKMAASRRRNLVICQIETAKGLANADEIAAVEGVDIVWVGHFDLTNSLGIPGQFSHPDYVAGIEKVVAAARRNNKPAGFMALDEQWAADYWALGFDIIAFGLDHLLYQQALASGLKLLGNLRATGR
ncbi:MAG: hpch/hpai aldolase [Xanthobacteraceae bacterium]|jgi:2-dehydro-3-deoxyglucarate aldolase/4-hydroxy-2-oxoheptanedioate aldolase|nr:hpch/hpai aldolase [Xanthobacteraceae bacterium]